jgi:DNA-binding SARP family transcriptional activator/tetratricopeptide (TPR) repeat protein
MEFRILGSFEVLEDGRQVTPRRAKQRALLAMLVLRSNEVVASDVLVEALWGERPPLTAPKALHGHVSALRKLLGADRIATQPPGYSLRVEPGELDADRFESLVAEASRIDGLEGRAEQLSSALALWRGAALAEFRSDEFARAEIARLEERRLTALEDRFDAELALGRHTELLVELEQLVADQPLRERPRAQRMLALYRAGRQSEALHVFQEGRRILAEEIGIDPGRALQTLERQILTQDPALDPPRPAEAVLPRQERKRVTVLVAEFSCQSSTDPEELERLVRPALERAEETLLRFGATVQPLFSNALIGVFGAPRAHEDDADRAVRAGAALVDHAGLAVRVGIERGDALVTIEGGQINVTGNVVTAASRLQATAAENEVALGEALERVRSNGEGREVPFVGRRHELGLLEHAYERAVREHAAQLMTIAGEPGSGKTRLASELRTLLELDGRHVWLEGRCPPYGDGVTFWALGEIVKAAAGIFESDDPDTSARKLGVTVAGLLPESDDREWVAASLSPLVGLSAASSVTRSESFVAWRRFLEGVAERQPLVLLIEDLHWADVALVEFVDELVERCAGVPLLVLCTARLEFMERHPQWSGGKRNAATITLPPLSAEETREVVRVLLGGDEPSQAVVARAGGNPLFAQELARVEVGETTSLPESLHAVIAARLDTLAPAVKQAAMDAAVIGEVFWPGAVAAVAGIDALEIQERLHRLVAGDVVRPARTSAVRGQREHAFLHVLVRDVAYDQIPKAQRAQKHAAAAEWLEQLAGERVLDHAELIAHHYVAALEHAGDGDTELSTKTRHFLTLAGDRALRLDVAAAERFYRQALALAHEDDSERGYLLAQLARAAQDAGRLADAEHLFDQAIVALRAGGDARALGRALTDFYRGLWRRGAGREATSALAEALRVLRSEPPGTELAAAYAAMAHHHVLLGRSRRAVKCADRAIALADRLGLPQHVVHALQFRGSARCAANDLGGLEDLREALRLGLETVGGIETGVAYNHLADWIALVDGPESSLETYAEGIEFAERRGLEFRAHWLRMSTLEWLHELGRWDELLALADELLTWDRRRGGSQMAVFALAHQACVLSRRGAVAEARSLVAAFLEQAREIGVPQVLTVALTYAAIVERASGRDRAAIERLEELEHATRDLPSIFRARYLTDAARVCAAIGALEPARRLGSDLDVVAPDLVYRVLSARAVLGEAEGRLGEALAGYIEAAGRWHEFGNVLEEAYALFGHGRCLLLLDRSGEAAEPLAGARAIFERLGAQPLVDEIDEQSALPIS